MVVFAALLACPVLLTFAAEPSTVGEVLVDLNKTVVASFQGMGVQFDPFDRYPPAPEKWKLILSRLDRLQPAFFRVMTNANALCRYVNADGKHSYIWDEPKEKHPGAWKHFEQLRAILTYAQSKDWHVILGEWGPPTIDFAGKSEKLNTEDPRWAAIIADYVKHLRNDEGFTCIRYYNLVNEPNGNWSGNKSYETWTAGIRNLHAKFREASLDKDVLIVGPDTTGNTKWLEPFTWLDRVAQDLSAEVGVYDLHWYAQDDEVFGGLMEKLLREKREHALKTDPRAKDKLMVLGESGILSGKTKNDQQHRVKNFEYGVMMADYTAQVGRAGWMGVTAWDLDDAMHLNVWKDLPAKPKEEVLKVWGFWNSSGTDCGMPEQEACRPWYYTWTVMSQLFPRGTRIVQADAPAWPRFRVMAGTDAAGKELCVMLVNNADEARLVHLRVSGAGTRALRAYRYFENDRPAGEDGLPLPKERMATVEMGKGAAFALPSRGVLFLTTR
jgi:hypothetical protein